MIIPVGTNVRFAIPDPYNITIERRKVVKEGKNAGTEVWSTVGYYSSLSGAAKSLLGSHIELLVGDREVKNLRGFAELVAQCSAGIEEACAGADQLIREERRRGKKSEAASGEAT